MICIYHRNNDGRCAAAIVNKRFGRLTDIDFIGMQYGEDLPWETFSEHEHVVIVDFSLKKHQWDHLFEVTQNVTWIDHHISAIEDEDNPHHLPGVRENGVAGAMLTWDYFYSGITPPLAVKFISDYDIWAFRYGDTTKEFSQGLWFYDTHPQSNIWETLLCSHKHETTHLIGRILKDGRTIIKHNKKTWASIVKRQSISSHWEGYRIQVVNLRGPSLVFESLELDTCDLLVLWSYTGKYYQVNVFTQDNSDVDVSKICKKYGGGGHRGAGGFEIKKLPHGFFEDLTKRRFEI